MTQEEKPPFPNFIKAARKNNGITAKQLADKIGTTEATMSRLESGKQSLSQDWLLKISDALGIEVFELLTPRSHIAHTPIILNIRLHEPYVVKTSDNELISVINFPKHLIFNKEQQIYTLQGSLLKWLVVVPETKLSATKSIGKRFLIRGIVDDKHIEYSIRRLTLGKDGLFLVDNEGDPSRLSLRLEDDVVVDLRRIVATIEQE